MAVRRFAPVTYMIQVCDRCQRHEPAGVEGAPCPSDDCEGRLVETEVVPVAMARHWRADSSLAEEKVERLNAELADTFQQVERARSGKP